MNLPPARLIALDLDGTLLDETGRVPSARIAVLEEAARRGVRVTLATGRMYASARSFLETAPLNAPLISYNGALIRDPRTELTWFHRPLEAGLAREVLGFLRERGVYVQAYVDDRFLVERASHEGARAYARLTGLEPLEVGEALYRLQAPPTKLLVIQDPREIPPLEASLREAFGSRVHVAGSQKGFLEVVPRGIHKGLALLWLADALGIPRGQVLALGDGDNDAEMLASVPLGVAVPQGSLRARAGAAFTAPEGEDPVVWAVRRFALEGRGFPSP